MSEQQSLGVRADSTPSDPGQPDNCRQQRKPQHFTYAEHPGARPRDKSRPARDERDEHVGRGKSDTDRSEHGEDHDSRACKRKAHGRTEEGCRARSCERDGQGALEEAARRRGGTGRRAEGGARSLQRDIEGTKEVHGKDDENRANHRQEYGVLELKAPAHSRPGRTQRDHDRCEGRHRDQHTRQVGQTVLHDMTALGASEVGNAEDLDRQHRKHTGHEVEDQATEQSEHKRPDEGRSPNAGRRPAVTCVPFVPGRRGQSGNHLKCCPVGSFRHGNNRHVHREVRSATGPCKRNDTAQPLSADLRLIFEGVRDQG